MIRELMVEDECSETRVDEVTATELEVDEEEESGVDEITAAELEMGEGGETRTDDSTFVELELGKIELEDATFEVAEEDTRDEGHEED